MPMPRPCDRCKKTFVPNSRVHRVCYACIEKAREERKKKMKQRKNLNRGENNINKEKNENEKGI